MQIPFNKPTLTGKEGGYVQAAIDSRAHCGNRFFGGECTRMIEEACKTLKAFLTPSCTAALEMGAIVADLKPGDEVILPSYTFSSTANAIVLQGARPVFCDIETDTMNIDCRKIESLITDRTKMILPIDYAGIPCDMDTILAIANRHKLLVMVDAAQSINSRYTDGTPVGSKGHLVTYSFHESKNLNCGEGGALCVNAPDFVEKATFVQEKGTDRSLVLKGVKSKYWWVSKGSSFLLADILAAMLKAQLEDMNAITEARSRVTQAYRELFSKYERAGNLKTPHVPAGVQVNHHAFWVLFDSEENQVGFLRLLREKDIHAYVGYMPLHSSPMGKGFGYHPDDLPITQTVSTRIVRLPFYTDLQGSSLTCCISGMEDALKNLYG